MTKHWLQRIHCPRQLVKEMFIKRFKDNDWDEQNERDATEFLNIEKSIFVEDFPMYAHLFADDEEENDVEEEDETTTKVGGGRRRG
ncbi:hypothetical protein ACHAXH_009756 [Discostella pseudostelligera]|jgi:hypothetical protein